MTSRWRIILWLLLIFAGGVAAGWLAARRTVGPRPLTPRLVPMATDETLREMETRLRLRPAQVELLAPLVAQWRDQTRLVASNSLQRRFELFERMVPLLRTNLGPLQQRSYDRDAERIRERFRRALSQLATTNSPGFTNALTAP